MFEKPKKERTRWKGLIYGATGTYKTRFALSLPNPAIIDYDDGTEPYKGEFNYHMIPASTTQQAHDAVDWLLTNKHDFLTLIIDPITIYWQALQNEWADILLKKKPPKSTGHMGEYYDIQAGDWRLISGTLYKMVRKIRMLDMNVVFTAYEKDEYEEGGFMKKTGNKIPDCHKNLPHAFDNVLRFYKTKGGEFRVSKHEKDRSNKLPNDFALFDNLIQPLFTTHKSKPIELITEEQLVTLENIKIQVCSNEKYKIDETKWLGGLKKHGVDSESELTKAQADEWIEAWDKYIKKVTDENEEK